MSARMYLGFAIAALALPVGGAATAQKLTAVSPLNQLEAPSLAQRIGALEQQNSQLQSEVSQLQHQLAEAKAAEGSDVFKDRFRITALELNAKQGGTPAQLGQQLTDMSSRVTGLQAKVDGIDASLTHLTAQYAGHTHTYGLTKFGWANHQIIPPVKLDEPTQTSLPQNAFPVPH